MGAWEYLQPKLSKLIAERCPLYYLGRPRSSSPAEGWSVWHKANQKLLVAQAYDLETKNITEETILWERLG
jgi:2-oxoglutarate dehydrogenase E1 component